MSLASALGIQIPSLTKTVSGSKMVDAAVAANDVAKTVQNNGPLPVDKLLFSSRFNPADFTDDSGMWFLFANSANGKNGLYKHDYPGQPLYYVTQNPVGTVYTDGTNSVRQLDDMTFEDLGANVKTITPEPTTQISMPGPNLSTSVPILTDLGTTLPGNTGIVGPGVVSEEPAKTAFGLNINPLYIIGAIVVIIGAWYAHKKGMF